MKKSSKILLLVITVMTIIMAMAVTASADAGSDAATILVGDYGICIANWEEKTCLLRYYEGTDTDVVIPTEFYVEGVDEANSGTCKVVGIDRAECFSSTSSYIVQSPPVITSFKVEKDNVAFTTIDGVLFSKDKKTLIRYPEGKKDASYTIPSTVTTISECAFENCSYLENVTIPDSVTSIQSRAFVNSAIYNNENNWENGVLYIDKALIDTKSELSGSYTIKTGTKTIAEDAFKYCKDLTKIIVPASVYNITEEAFTEYEYIYGHAIYKRIKTIVGYNGTSAETYANENGHKFISLGGPSETYTGLYKYGDLWCYAKNGKLDYDYTGLAKYNGKWYYVEDGIKDGSFNGLVEYGKSLYYVKNGIVDKSYTGLVKHSDGKYYYVKSGVKTSFNGLVKYNSKWYCVKNGVVDKSYTGLVKHTDGKYYYVKNGVKTSFNGLVKYNSKWYHVKDGVKTTYTGLVKHTDGKYYYVKSGVKTSFNGLVKYNSKWYYVKNGAVDKSYTGLVKHTDGKYYYVKSGVKTSFNGLVKYNSKWYYVNKGVVDKSYTGYVTYNGKKYKVVKGVKV